MEKIDQSFDVSNFILITDSELAAFLNLSTFATTILDQIFLCHISLTYPIKNYNKIYCFKIVVAQ